MREATCVILAAGLGERLGGGKLALPFRGGTILDAVLAACKGMPTLVVIPSPSSSLAQARYAQDKLRFAKSSDSDAISGKDNVRTIRNDAPERGMAHSLKLANREIPAAHRIAVLLGDKPLVTGELIRKLLDADDADVVYPKRDGTPGHPVIFSPNARALIDALPDGDTLQRLRDDPSLTRRAVPIDDDGAYIDVDTEDDYRRLRD